MNEHTVHAGFVTANERDWVVGETRSLARIRKFDPPESDPLFLANAYRRLCEMRAGSPLPLPSLARFRDWDLGAVVACDLSEFGDLDAYNEKPEQSHFVSKEERAAVLLNARSTAKDGDVRNASYEDVWRFIIAARAGTMLAVPSYKMVRGNWDSEIQS